MKDLNNKDNDFKKNAVSIKNLTVRFGTKVVLEDVSLDVDEREYVGIIGPNGGGKTTLLKAILGLVESSSGKIDIYGNAPGATGKLIGYVPQQSDLNKSLPITVKEVVVMGNLKSEISLFHKYKRGEMEQAYELLEKVGIYNLKDRLVFELSGGEFQKMLIARALATSPRILLLDEPTASVDASSRNQIYKLLEELNKDMTIILVTHDLLAVSCQVRSLACLNVRLVHHGETKINGDIVEELYGCPIDLIAHGVPHRVLKEHQEGK